MTEIYAEHSDLLWDIHRLTDLLMSGRNWAQKWSWVFGVLSSETAQLVSNIELYEQWGMA